MPTGYTAPIKDGISFEEFALGCARAFGALVMMRDEPAGAPIPEKFEPSDYNKKQAEHHRQRIDELIAMTADDVEKAAENEWRDAEENRLKNRQEMLDLKAKYKDMLAKVIAWQPPTPNHANLKEFMLDQLEESIGFDTDDSFYNKPTERMTGDAWRANQIRIHANLQASCLKYHAEEVDRTNKRNEWISALRQSLAPKEHV